MRRMNFTNLWKMLMVLTLITSVANVTRAQFGCGSAVVLTDGYTQFNITTPGDGGEEDWNVNPSGTSESSSYWDDDVYLFEYTAGAQEEQISMTTFTRNGWNGIGIFENCIGNEFSGPLSEDGQSTSNSERMVSAMVSPGQTVYIAVGQWGPPNGLDFDVTEFTVATCFVPTELTSSNATENSVNLSWMGGGSETEWNVQYGAPGFDPAAGEGTTVVALTSIDFVLGGLDAGTDYDVYVQASCDGGSDLSNWSAVETFTTVATCPAPTGFSSANETATSVELSWTPGSDEAAWNIQYGAPGFDPVLVEGTLLASTSNTNFEVSGLSASSEYEFYVQAECIADTDLSTWVGPITVTTSCAVEIPPYTQDFSSFPPLCWTEAGNGSPSTGPENIGFSDWTDDEYINETDGSQAARVNLYFNSDREWLISPAFDLAGGPFQVEFDFAIVDYADSFPAPLGSDDRIILLVTEDGGTTWMPIFTWDSNYTSPQGGEYFIFPLSDYSGSEIQLAFWASDGLVNDPEDNDIFVDNFQLREVPSCPAPTFVNMTDVQTSSATLSWTVNGTESAWNVQYGTPGFDPAAGEGTTVAAATNTDFEITGLDAETDYEVYVQAVCEAGVDESQWISSALFTTLPTCPAPTNFELLTLTSDDAFLQWAAGGSEIAWNVQYGAPGFDPVADEGTTVDATSNINFELAGLSPNTEYDVYVQAECVEAIDESDWVGPINFTTDCEIFAVPYLEGFDDFLPSCWQEATTGDLNTGPIDFGSGSWTDDEYTNETGGSQAAKINLYNTSHSDWLLSPSLDLAGVGPFQLEFDFAITDFADTFSEQLGSDDSLTVVVSTDAGTSWTELHTFDASYTSPEGGEHIIIPLDGYEGNVINVAFWGSDGDVNDPEDIDVYVDNFQVREVPSCPEPINLTASAVEATSVTLSWEAGDTEMEWYIQYGTPGFDPTAEEGTTVVAATNTDFLLDGLDPETEYEIYVQAICEAGITFSDWITSTTLTTLPTCPQPIDLSLVSTSNNNAVIAWTAGGTETAWNVQYGTPGFDPTAAEGIIVEATDNTGFEILALTANTEYEVYVQAECIENTDLSSWTGPLTFNTDCDPFTPIYLEEFTTFLPECWSEAGNGDPTAGPEEFDDSDWTDDDFANSGSEAAKINLYSNSDQEWLISPLIDLTGGPFQVDFDFAITEWLGTSSALLGSDDEIQLLISTDNGVTWTNLMTWDATYISPIGGEMVVQELAAYSGEIVKFAIYATDGSVDDDADNDIFVDNFRVREIPSCPQPTDFTVTDVQANSVNLLWTAGSDETSWNIQYGTPGFDPTLNEGTTVEADTNIDFLLENLTELTDYQVYVQAECIDETDLSLWVGPISFSTPCVTEAITDFPWVEDFDGVNTPDLPCGWIAENANNDSYTWITDDGYPLSGENSLYIRWNSSQAMNDWAFTPELVLNAGETYSLQFYYRSSSSYTEDLEVFLGESANGADMTIELVNIPGIMDAEYQLQLLTFTVPQDGSYYVGFHGYSAADQFYIAVDDVQIDVCSADASFAYATDTLCTYNDPLAPEITGMQGGVFSADAGLDIDPETGEIDPSTSDLGEFTVSYEVTADSVCVDVETFIILIDPCTGVDEEEGLSSVNIYPNPSSNIVNIDLTGFNEKATLELMDLTGKVVLSQSVENPALEEINVSSLENGIYMIRISNGEQTTTKRIVVTR